MATQGWSTRDELDVDNASTEPPPPVDDGVYKVTFARAEPQLTKNQHPSAALDLHVESAYDGRDLSGFSKSIKFERIVFTRDAEWSVKQVCLATGLPAPRTNGYDDVQAFCDRLVGTQCFAQVGSRIANQGAHAGRRFPRIVKYLVEKEAAEKAAGSTAEQAAAGPAPARRKRA